MCLLKIDCVTINMICGKHVMFLHFIKHVCHTYSSLSLLLVSKSGEGNGTPLQYSCLENPMDGGAR